MLGRAISSSEFVFALVSCVGGSFVLLCAGFRVVFRVPHGVAVFVHTFVPFVAVPRRFFRLVSRGGFGSSGFPARFIRSVVFVCHSFFFVFCFRCLASWSLSLCACAVVCVCVFRLWCALFVFLLLFARGARLSMWVLVGLGVRWCRVLFGLWCLFRFRGLSCFFFFLLLAWFFVWASFLVCFAACLLGLPFFVIGVFFSFFFGGLFVVVLPFFVAPWVWWVVVVLRAVVLLFFYGFIFGVVSSCCK